MAEFGLFEAMYSARSVRRIKPDPVPDEVITKVLDAAIRAPSGSNAQGWVFIVVKDAEKRRQLGAVYKKASDILTKLYAGRERPAHMDEQQYERFMRSVSCCSHVFARVCGRQRRSCPTISRPKHRPRRVSRAQVFTPPSRTSSSHAERSDWVPC